MPSHERARSRLRRRYRTGQEGDTEPALWDHGGGISGINVDRGTSNERYAGWIDASEQGGDRGGDGCRGQSERAQASGEECSEERAMIQLAHYPSDLKIP